jgi:D-cysteine desulfhydrase
MNENLDDALPGSVLFPLFEAYPKLKDAIPRIVLSRLPTPIEPMISLESRIKSGARFFVKRDDLTSDIYGGNKARKLELLLAEAMRRNRKSVITFGAAGSNHALATAIFARKAGLPAISTLFPQHNARYLRRNLLMAYGVGAELHHCDGILGVALKSLLLIARNILREGQSPFIVAPGGSSPRGTVGYVNAAFELRRQIEKGETPIPDFIYIPCGTMGSAVGLALGMLAAGLESQIMAIRVVGLNLTTMKGARKLFRRANAFLHRADPNFPLFDFPTEHFTLRGDFCGTDYALFTEEGVNAMKLAKDTEGLKLEGTYTGKTFAAIIADASKGLLREKNVMFWNTYNSRDLDANALALDYHLLPAPFHHYFEEDLQPLDGALTRLH